MLDALLDEEFDTKKRQAKEQAKQDRSDLDALLDEPHDPGMTWGDVLHAAKTAALPTAGNVAGMVAGAFTGPFAPVAVPTLEAAGGMGGEYLNQVLGITPPSKSAIALQGILPPALRFGRLAKEAIPPSTAGANLLNTIAPREAEHVIASLGVKSGEAAKRMQAATAPETFIHTGDTRQAISEALDTMSGSTGTPMYAGTTDYLRRLDKFLYDEAGAISPARYQKELRDIRAKINLTGENRPNEVEKAALTKVKSALEDGLLNTPAGTKLAGARQDVLRESVVNDLEQMIYDASKNQAHQGAQRQWNGRGILDKIEGRGSKANQAFQRRFEAAFEPRDQQLIHKLFTKLNSFDKLALGAGVTGGSLSILSPTRTGAAVGGSAALAGAGPETAAAIGMTAMGVPPVLHAGRIISLALSTHEGRKELGRILADPSVKSWDGLLSKLVTATSAIEPVQSGIRGMSSPTMIQPMGNER